MSDTVVDSANKVQQWADDYFVEYVRGMQFKPYMGTDENSIIQVKSELTKQPGDRITISLVGRLTGTGVTGDNELKGNEETLINYGHLVTVDQLRNGVVVGKMEKVKTKIDLLDAAKTMLKLWSMENLRDTIIDRLQSPNVDGLTTYAASTTAQRNAWEVAQNPTSANQRVLFGAAKSNQSGVHATDLANVDGTNDDLAPAIISLGKRMAKLADPHIRPIKTDDGEWFVAFCGSLAFRDMQTNMQTILQYAAPRNMDQNPLFTGGDIVYDGVIVKEIPEIGVITGVGASNIDVTPVFLCGAQAIGLCWAQRPQPEMDEWDYQNRRGVAISEIRGVEKLVYNSVDHGMVTIYVSGVGD